MSELNNTFSIEEELAKLPDSPGVYIMHNSKDAIIYIGKAKSLTHRVHQYFQASHNEGIKKAQMVKQIARFEYIVTDTELEALVLECNLIKEHRPKYNTLLRDDKTYPYIKVTIKEPYPRILFTRSLKKDGSKYFGPFTSALSVKDTIDIANKVFKIRTCNQKFPESFGKKRPCLNYHMKQCDGICTGNISQEEYRKNIDRAIAFFEGDYKSITNELTEKMNDAAENLDFEKAAEYRDLIQSIATCIEKQKITDANTDDDRDIIAITTSEEDAVAAIFFVRNGKLIGREHYFINIRLEESEAEIYTRFIQQFYAGTPIIPRELILKGASADDDLLSDWLSSKAGHKVSIHIPVRGEKRRLAELAEKNANLILSQDRDRIKREEGRTIGALKELSTLIGIDNINRMEAYDISNISGFQTVGSMVVFEGGKAKKSDYRKFRLKTITGPDDYASMREVLTRRFKHGLDEKTLLKSEGKDEELGSFSKFPDIIMMDGGRGQVNICLEVLDELGISIPVCGMVKDDHHNTRGLYCDGKLVDIDKSSQAFFLITRIQDEAHRFAIEYHRSLRGKSMIKSFLDDIEGIGPTRRKAIMRAFGSVEKMREASVDDLASIDSMDQKSAQSVYDYFHSA